MGFWILVVAVIINLVLSFITLTRAARASSTAYFGISAFFIACWALGVLLLQFGANETLARIGLLLFLVAPMATTLYMVLFSKHFSGTVSSYKYLATGTFTLVLVVFASAVLFLLPGTDVIVKVSGMAGNTLNFQHAWFMLYGVYFVLMFSIAYLYLIAGMMHSKGRIHLQRKTVLIGIFATSFLALLTNIIFPLFGYTELIWLGPAWTIFYVVATSYAMVKHGLFDIRMALVLTFTYGLSLVALAILYYIIALSISLLLIRVGVSAPQNFSGINVVVALILAFLFQPIRLFFDKVTSNIFYQDSYNVASFFADLSRNLTSTNNLHTLLHRASEKIGQTFKANDVSFVVYTGPNRIEQIGTGSYARTTYKDVLWLDQYLGETGLELKMLAQLEEDDEPLRRMMVSHRISIILPLIRQNIKLGYLLLGDHKRNGYTARDMRVVQALADELVIAIQNALSVEEIRQLNAHLEQRIDSATRELRTSNAQLQRLDEAKDEFISMASHQLRTPLTSIKGYVSMLIEGDVGKVSDEQKHLLNEVFISSERMVRLIGDFLNVSRLQTGKFIIEKRPVDFALLVQREIEGLAQNAAARGVKFIYKKPKNIPILKIDENKIQQVVMNFSDNAMYYSKEKSKITVTLKKIPGYVEFKVIDSGIGVPENEQPHLFNKFFRATNARRARPDGTGVGLFLAKKVIDEHGGKIIFESKEGKGSTFGFQLPLPKE